MLLSFFMFLGCGVFYAHHVSKPQYVAKMSLLVNMRPSAGQSVSSEQSLILASQQLLPTYQNLLQSQSVQGQAYSELPHSMQTRVAGLSVAVFNPKSTQILNVSVTASSAQVSVQYAKDLVSAFTDKATSIMGAQSVQIIDEPTVGISPSHSPLYIGISAVFGLLTGGILAILFEIIRNRIRNEGDAERIFGMRVLGAVPKL